MNIKNEDTTGSKEATKKIGIKQDYSPKIKPKVQFLLQEEWKPQQRPEYIKRINRSQARTVSKGRSRLIAKDIYKKHTKI